MGLSTTSTDQRAVNELQGERFGAFFSRAFACALSLTGNEARAREVVIEAFSRIFGDHGNLSDDEFVVSLFHSLRELCRALPPNTAQADQLTGRERELLALVFDARLSRDVIRRITRTSEEGISSALLSALRKLRGDAVPAATASLHFV
jgi:hypothetical protein